MRQLWLHISTLALMFCAPALAQEGVSVKAPSPVKTADSTAIYQGMSIKWDAGDLVMSAATSRGRMFSHTLAMNWRLKQRFFPTLELGAAHGAHGNDTTTYSGAGGFGRVGLDISALKKHPESPNVLLVGLRLGTGLQSYSQQTPTLPAADHLFRADCWGEIAAGCQVQVWKGLQMGWQARFKVLFTRQKSADEVVPYYIPGYGRRGDTAWGLSYFIGYAF